MRPATWGEAVGRVLPWVMEPEAVVLLDGRSGSGKTTLADGLLAAAGARGRKVRALRLDEMYQGWDGLLDAAGAAARDLVEPLARGEAGRWEEYDWHAGRVVAAHIVEPGGPVLVEGAGALTPRTAVVATFRVWLAADDGLRRARALARDGETFRPHWERWARQEETHIARHAPAGLADLVIDTDDLLGGPHGEAPGGWGRMGRCEL